MRVYPIVILAGLALAAGPAMAQDTPPPGCRWMGETLACKDGKGNLRRAGDDEIVGHYPMPKPKPKPTPAPKLAAAPTPRPNAIPSPDRTLAPLPPLETAPVYAEANAVAPAADAAPAQAAETFVVPPEPAVAAAPPKPKPWWQAILDWIGNALDGFLRMIGLRK